MNITPRNKMVAMGGAVVVVIIAVIVLKSFVFISPTARAMNAAISQAQADLKSAQAKIASNDLIGAHSTLVAALSTLTTAETKDGSSGSANSTKTNLTNALDKLDMATDASESMVADIPTSSGTVTLLNSNASNLYVYLDQNGSGTLAQVAAGSSTGLGITTAVTGLSPTGIFSSNDYVSLVDSASKNIASLSIAKSSLAVTSFSIADSITDLDVFSDNLYMLTPSGITKIADAASGHTTTTSWLAAGTTLADNPVLITVDGNVYVLSSDGTLTTYYKGAQTSKVATPVAASAGNMLLSTSDGKTLYVIDKTLGRIYELDKATGSLIKTLKTNTSQPITTAAIGSDDTIYIVSNNQIWKVD